MEAITKKEFKDYPDTSTPITSEWLNEFQDKIIANFTEIETKLAKTLTYTVVTESSENTSEK